MKIALYISLFFTAITVSGQEISPTVIASAGDSYTTSNIQIDWTLGELAITSIQNDELLVTQGFHQPRYLITSNDNLVSDIVSVNLYPNPTSDRVLIDFDLPDFKNLIVDLIDLNGRLLWEKRVEGKNFSDQFILSELPAAAYFLRIRALDNSFSKVYTIQKIN